MPVVLRAGARAQPRLLFDVLLSFALASPTRARTLARTLARPPSLPRACRAASPAGRACCWSWPRASPRFVFWLLPSRLSSCPRRVAFYFLPPTPNTSPPPARAPGMSEPGGVSPPTHPQRAPPVSPVRRLRPGGLGVTRPRSPSPRGPDEVSALGWGGVGRGGEGLDRTLRLPSLGSVKLWATQVRRCLVY